MTKKKKKKMSSMFPGKLAGFVGSGQKGPDVPTGAPLAFFHSCSVQNK